MSSVHVGCWRNDYRVPRAHPAAWRVRERLDTVFDRMRGELADGLSPYLDGLGDAVILIRRLECDGLIDVAADGDRAARGWARRVAVALIEAIERGDDGVVRFRDQAAYRARFVADLARGTAWHTWFYRPFDGLRVLPAAAAIRTVLLDDTTLGRAALGALADADWRTLALALTPAEARRLLDGLCEDGDAAAIDVAQLDALLARLADAARCFGPHADIDTAALYLLARNGAAPPAGERAWARALAWLAGTFAPPDDTVAIALRSGDAATLARRAGGIDPAVAYTLLHAPATLRQRLASRWRTSFDTARDSDETGCEFAGLALLLHELDELLDTSLVAALPPCDEAAPRDLAALTALSLAAGDGRAGRVWRDPFWRDFLRVPPRCDEAALSRWLADASADATLTAIDARVATFARGAPAALRVPFNDVPTQLRVDRATGLWLGAGVDDAPLAWRERLALTRRAAIDARTLDSHFARSLPPAWRFAFARLAQAAWRRLAWRVPGCAGATPAYLYANLLGVPGVAVRASDGTVTLRVARPPLYVLLALGGARRRIAWRATPAGRIDVEYAA